MNVSSWHLEKRTEVDGRSQQDIETAFPDREARRANCYIVGVEGTHSGSRYSRCLLAVVLDHLRHANLKVVVVHLGVCGSEADEAEIGGGDVADAFGEDLLVVHVNGHAPGLAKDANVVAFIWQLGRRIDGNIISPKPHFVFNLATWMMIGR